MDLLSIIFIALGLAMDAFAVSISCGICDIRNTAVNALKAGSAFGLFQGAMTALGWLAGFSFRSWIEPLDHWIAFILLGFIGINMIREAMDDDCKPVNLNEFKMLITLSIATSLDAMAAGISLATLGESIILPAILITSITFVLSYLGVYLGKVLCGNTKIRKYIDITGGLILIGIGLKILLEHTL